MNTSDISNSVTDIHTAYETGDFDGGHQKTEDLFTNVLEAIRDGHTDPVGLATAALMATEIN